MIISTINVDPTPKKILIADKDYVRQLHQIFKKADLEIDGIIPNTLAQRNLILDTHELNDNIMLLDIGAGNTEIGVFYGKKRSIRIIKKI